LDHTVGSQFITAGTKQKSAISQTKPQLRPRSRAFLGVRLKLRPKKKFWVTTTAKSQMEAKDVHGLAAFFTPAALTLTGVQDQSQAKITK